MASNDLEMTIAGRRIADDEPPYIIAELSANHNGSLDTALKIIEEAHKAGADAIKLQSYTADTITMECASEHFQIKGGLWGGKTLYELYQEAHMPWEWHKPLFDHARNLGITIFSSPFDNTAVDLLEDLNTPAYKIASFEAIDLPLIKYVASTGKPMIISTGMANEEEIYEAVDTAREAGCKELAILHCISGYPAPAEDYNLKTILDMKKRFGTLVGLSDHTLGNVTALASVALGASIIEKHFTLDRKGGGPDDSFSMEPQDLKSLCEDARITSLALGGVNYTGVDSEKSNKQFRRSLYAVESIAAGEKFTSKNIKSIRPGFGLPPKQLDHVLGRKAKIDIKRGTAMTASLIEGESHEKNTLDN